MDELAARIDAQRAGRELLARLARLSAVEREALELVDLAGLTPHEAASVLGVAPGALRVRLFRARRRLRTKGGSMNTFEDQLWSHLVAEHGERLRGARVATTALAATLDEDSQRATGRRRLVRLSAAGVLTGAAAGAALTLGLTGVLGHGTIATSAPGAIRTPSYTLVSYTTGKVALTINPKELFDAAALQSDLARDGIPAKVTAGSFCSSDPAPAGFSQVVSVQPAGEFTAQAGTGQQPTITFDPSAIPAGTELSFGDFQLTNGQQVAAVALIDTSSYTCTGTPPTTGALQVVVGDAARS
jgi:hypothetical protein